MNRVSSLALAFLLAYPFTIAAGDNTVPSARSRVIPRNLHERIWENVTSQVDAAGRMIERTNSYTEIRSFLNRFDENTGGYVPASEGIEIINGFGVSRNTAYKLIVSGNQNANEGAVDILMPGGERMILQCVGLAYYEPETGNAVWIAEAKDSIGIVEGNAVVWRDAFDDVRAAIRVEARLDAVEHDVLIEEQLPDPALFGLNGKVRLQVWHRLIQRPNAAVRQDHVVRQDGVNEVDSDVHFGAMKLDRGAAFPIDAETWGMGGDNRAKEKGAVHVSKEWARIQDSDWLIETLPLDEVWPQLQDLPAPAIARKVNLELLKERMLARAKTGRMQPMSVASGARKTERRGVVASITRGSFKPARGYLVDYITRSTGVTDHRWRGDTVYYISGPIACSGANTVFEAGTVLKYAANASITINAPLTWEATPYRPIVLTAKDDNSVGETISGSTGNPNTSYYANPALYIASGLAKLQNFRIAHAQKGILFYDTTSNTGHGVTHAQFVHCDKAIQVNGYGTSFKSFYARNVLMTDCGTAFYGYSFNGSVEHLTLKQGTRLAEDYNGQWYGTTSSLALTNSILAGVGTLSGSRSVTVTGDRNGFYNTQAQFGANQITSAENPLQTIHAGAGYLVNGSNFRNAGISSVTPSLKHDLAKLTTYPPKRLSGDFTETTTLAPAVPRGGNSLGYHYDPIDYYWTSLAVKNNSTLRLTNGVAVASYGPQLVTIFGGSSVSSIGNPTNPNRIVTYHSVQEQPGVWITNYWHTLLNGHNFKLRFTDISVLAGAPGARALMADGSFNTPISVTDSSLRGVDWGFSYYSGSGTTPTIALTNNILQRCNLRWAQGTSSHVPFQPDYFSLSWRNNLFSMCSLTLWYYSSGYGSWTISDNLFDTVSLSMNHVTSALTGADYNGFIATANPFNGAHDRNSLLRDFVDGPLGKYYYPNSTTANSLSSLKDAGSKNSAADAGLYHFTTSTTQDKEATTQLDIGAHYPALEKVRFIGVDTLTKGNWKGKYGSEGHIIVSHSTSLPSYANVSTLENSEGLWQSSTSDTRALSKLTGERIAACWYSGTSFDVTITQSDSYPHRIALYLLDWDTSARAQTIELRHPVSGAVYDSRSASSFNGGQYYVWDVVGNVTIRLTKTGSFNSVLSGIFFDSGVVGVSDYDIDRYPDLVEDINGNGVPDSGERSWQNYNSESNNGSIPNLMIFTPLN